MPSLGSLDKLCPHCNGELRDLYNRFISESRQSAFHFDCPYCKNTVEVHAHESLSFEVFKAHRCAGCDYRIVPDDVSLCMACLAKANR